MPTAANRPAPASDPTMRAESDVVREAPMALTKRSGGMVSATRALRIARSDGRTRPATVAMMNTCSGRSAAGERERHQQQRQHRIAGAHRAQHGAMAEPVAGHAEHRRHQRAEILQRAEQGEQQNRAGLGEDVPAEDQRLHLAAPGGEQVRRVLEAEAADPERREQRGRCHRAHRAAVYMAGRAFRCFPGRPDGPSGRQGIAEHNRRVYNPAAPGRSVAA